MSTRLKLVLVNLCEDTCGYTPSSSEHLRAQLIATTDLAERCDVSILFLENETPESAARQVLEQNPDLVGFTAFSWNIADSGQTARLIKAEEPRLPIVWGGCSFALFRERHDWFTWWDCVDAVAIGSGELTLVGLVRHLLRSPKRALDRPLPGLVVKRNGSLAWGPPAPQPAHFSDLASPYLVGTVYRGSYPFLEMARGCKFQCTFCSDAKASREGMWRTHSVERIASEIAAVVHWPEAQGIDAGSSTANINDREFASVCEAIRRGDPGGRLEYTFQMYPALSRPAQRAALEGIRVGRLCFGVQSFTPSTWKPILRRTTLDHLDRSMSVFGGTGTLQVSLLLGLPGETLEGFKQTFDDCFARGWNICVNRLLVLPGTQLHRDHERFGLRFREDLYYRVTESNTMNNDDLRRAQDFVIERSAALSAAAAGGRSPITWTNFDQQATMFAATRV